LTETLSIKVDPAMPRQSLLEALAEPARVLREGGTVAFPTETVYGLGANALDPLAVGKIFAAKGRPSDNPLIVHIARLDELAAVVREVPDAVSALAGAFWPGPLTLVLPKSDLIPASVTAGLDTVGVRMPSHPVASALIEKAGVPVAAPSANVSGRPSPTTAQHVWADLAGRVDVIVDGGPAGIGVESTVLDLTGDAPTVLRPGGVSLEQLAAVVPGVRALDDFGGVTDVESPRSPGLKHRHYSPRAPLKLFIGDHAAQAEAILQEAQRAIGAGEDGGSEPAGAGLSGRRAGAGGTKVGLLVSVETLDHIRARRPDLLEREDVVLSAVGSRGALEGVASALFGRMRELDQASVSLILAESYPVAGIGLAVMNRLMRAAGGRVVFLCEECRK